jgi:hypothetical protein
MNATSFKMFPNLTRFVTNERKPLHLMQPAEGQTDKHDLLYTHSCFAFMQQMYKKGKGTLHIECLQCTMKGGTWHYLSVWPQETTFSRPARVSPCISKKFHHRHKEFPISSRPYENSVIWQNIEASRHNLCNIKHIIEMLFCVLIKT